MKQFDEATDLTPEPTERITTRRAALGQDLWIAIEAAQYARVILCEEPQNDVERDAQTVFVETLTQHVEDWEQTSPIAQATALESVGRRLEELDRAGFRVHWAVTERTVEQEDAPEETMPLAVFIVDRTDVTELTVDLPLDLDMVDGVADPGDD